MKWLHAGLSLDAGRERGQASLGEYRRNLVKICAGHSAIDRPRRINHLSEIMIARAVAKWGGREAERHDLEGLASGREIAFGPI